MIHPYQTNIDLCEEAVLSVRNLLPLQVFSEAIEYITKYDEWLLGVELAIDIIGDEEQFVDIEQFKKFEKAYSSMNKLEDERLKYLRSRIIRRSQDNEQE